jgi:hypothetical protein
MRFSLRSWLIALVFALSTVGLSAAALAGGPSAKGSKSLKPAASADCVKAKKRGQPCKITIREGDPLEGGVASGSGESVVVRDTVTHSSLIRLRISFRDLIIRTGERF